MGTTPPEVPASRHQTGGIALHEAPTRRRHTPGRLRVVQNPHRCRCGERRAASKTGAGSGAKKLAQRGPSISVSAKILAPHAQKHRNWSVLSELGELFRAYTTKHRRRVKNFAHRTQKHGDVETNNTTAHPNKTPLKPTTPLLAPNEGPLKPASPLRPKTAPQTPVSDPHRRWRFQTHTDTSKQRRRRFQMTGPPGQQGQAAVPVVAFESALRKVARNSIGRSFNKVKKRCNDNDLISKFERGVGELRAKLGVVQEWGR